MRLIDADVMHGEIDKYNPEGRMSLKNIKRYIDAQPTAYDIDKVMEQLEKLEKEHPYKVIGQPDTYSQYNEAWQDCMDRVLDIVKKGGAK